MDEQDINKLVNRSGYWGRVVGVSDAKLGLAAGFGTDYAAGRKQGDTGSPPLSGQQGLDYVFQGRALRHDKIT
ncbi:MAG: hypothetical protein B7Z75_04625 [Acidocella sp. 20-57-95]|nr:MAG: hypothetical protein B7Z75_04625 [Acidocella sp. 20-57-95]HQT64295.1 hypothetical protein [Acidocella sp.]